MKKNIIYISLLGFCLAFNNQIKAQDYINKTVKNKNGNISLITFRNGTVKKATVSSDQLFKDFLSLSPDTELRLEKSEAKDKFTDEKYTQYYKNIPVEYGVYNLHYKNGDLTSMNGEVFSTDNIVTTSPKISAIDAFSLAVKSVGAQKYMWEDENYVANNSYKKPKGELVLLPVQNGENSYNLTLAYKFDIYAAEPISRAIIYVDALEGRILASDALLKHTGEHYAKKNEKIVINAKNSTSGFPQIVSGTAETRYSGTKTIETKSTGDGYILLDETRGGGIHTFNLRRANSLSAAIEFKDNDNNWTASEYDNTNYDNAALDAHWGVEKTYDYFKDTFNRNSYDNNGALIKSYVHFQYNYENAGWTGDEMIYGDGANLFSPLTGFDITAHELGHAVCQHTAALAYERESGALNEGFSDIWASIVEHKYAPEKQPFLIGEDITKITPGYLRSMSEPKTGYTAQPDTYHGTYWKAATVAEGCIQPDQLSNDYCGVHTNSGVLNHWFYILVMGKTGTNDLGKNYNVTGIGWDKAEQIVYRLESTYLTSTSDYKNTRDLAIQVAQDLYGEGTPEAIAVQDAFFAVGIGYKYLATPDTTPPSIPLNLNATNVKGTSLQLNWDPSTDNEDMLGYIVYKDGVEIGRPTANTFKVTGLSKLTTYNFTLKAVDIFNNISNESIPLSVTTTDFAEYCQSKSNNASSERIQRVIFADIDNASTETVGYEDFTNVQTEVEKGQTYQISITPEWRATSYSEGYAVFIDWNSDGDFDDAGEIAFTKSATKDSPVIGNITVPSAAVLDEPLAMRISMKFNGIPSACETIPYGQVEDYRLIVKEHLAVNESGKSKNVIYPNPTTGKVTVKSDSNVKNMEVYSTSGQMIISTGKSEIDLSSRPSGVYFFKVNYANGTSSSEKIIKK